MSITSEVTQLQTNLTNSYAAVQQKGGTIPSSQCFNNLATAIGTIEGGTDTYQAELLLEDIVRHGSLESEPTVVAQTTSVLETILGE